MNQTSDTESANRIHWIYFIGDIAIMGWSDRSCSEDLTLTYDSNIEDLHQFAMNLWRSCHWKIVLPHPCKAAFID